jgi:fructuronate reductase
VSVRLSTATLHRAHADHPAYDRAVPPAIVHLGVGAFARAHLGTYADDLLRAAWPATIRGVSLRSRRAEEELAPQDGLYAVVEREPDEAGPPRVVGAITSVRTGFAAAIEAIAAASTRLVTLTVTEKGYEPGEPAPAALARALARRRRAGLPAPVVASLDNVLGNGDVLRARVLEAADPLDAAVAGWIAEEVRFPCSVVDRMVPATTQADLELITEQLGVVDDAAVAAERHRSWVITAADGLPPLADVGVQVVADIGPYERRKLWLLNGPHSALAYLGLLSGCATIAEAATHPRVAPSVRRLVDEVLEVADLPDALEPAAFAADALRRFRNPSLGHTCVKVAEDGSRKLPQRLLPVLAARQRAGLPAGRAADVVGAWIALVAGLVPAPPVVDPAADDLRRLAAHGDLRALTATALGGPDHVDAVIPALQRILEDGATGFR